MRGTLQSSWAHQWAEVALEGVGWVQFGPTASLGPPSRTQETTGKGAPTTVVGDASSDPIATTIEITQWPRRMERKVDLVIGGAVRTTSGRQVNGMAVEIFINESKEWGHQDRRCHRAARQIRDDGAGPVFAAQR